MELPQLDALIDRAVNGVKLFMYPPNVTGNVGLEAMRHDQKRTHVSWKLESTHSGPRCCPRVCSRAMRTAPTSSWCPAP